MVEIVEKIAKPLIFSMLHPIFIAFLSLGQITLHKTLNI